MQAAVLHALRDIRMEEVREPKLGDGEVLIEPHKVGVCGSDVRKYCREPEGPFPLILGHECSGHIVQIGPGVTSFEIGQRVVIQPNFGCGRCLQCRMGRDNLCPNRVSLGFNIDGCFAERVKAPARYVHPIPGDLTDEEGALVEPLAVATRAVGRIGDPLGKQIMILGAGPIGLLVFLMAKLAGATVFLADLVEERLTLGKSLGADAVIDVSKSDPKGSALSLTAGKGVDAVAETAGITQTFEQAIEMVKPGGRIVLVGLTPHAANISMEPLVRKEIEIFGSYIYSYQDFSRAIQVIHKGKGIFTPLISHRFPLKDTGKAIETTEKGKGIKVMVNLGKETK